MDGHEPESWTEKYLGDLVYGANDGIITTFAVVSGATGAQFESLIIIVLGFANLIADGISMAVSSYLSERSEKETYLKEKRRQQRVSRDQPKTFEKRIHHLAKEHLKLTGKDLSSFISILKRNKKVGMDFILSQDQDLTISGKKPWISGVTTFIAFVIAGLFPLIAFLFDVFSAHVFLSAIIFTAVTLFIVGSLRTLVTKKKWWVSGLEQMLVGAIAAGAAFGIGALLRSLIGFSL